MQFVKKINPVDHRYDLYLDTSGLDIPDQNGTVEDYKTFLIESYTNISSAKKTSNWETNFLVINNFFNSISIDDRRAIALALLTMHGKIVRFMKTVDEEMVGFESFLNELDEIVVTLDTSIELFPKILDFCKYNISYPDESTVVRPQDTPVLTWKTEHIVKITALAILCKMLAPIFGTLMFHLMRQCKIETGLKELHCVSIIKSVIYNRLHDIDIKFKEFIRHKVNKFFEESLETIHKGMTESSIEHHLYAKLLVRHMINFDPYKVDGNIMTSLSVNSGYIITWATSCNDNSNRVFIRKDPQLAGEGDDAKKSQLEIDSIISNQPADAPVLAKIGTQNFVSQQLVEFCIPNELFDQAVSYYYKNPVKVHNLNKLLIYQTLGPRIGGAKAVRLLYSTDIIPVVAILQLLCIHYGYRELAHALSSIQGLNPRAMMDSDDIYLKGSFSSSNEYKHRHECYAQHCFGRQTVREFENQIKNEIIESIVVDTYLFNTAPAIWNLIGEAPLNGLPIRFTPNLIPALCTMIDDAIIN